MKARRLFHGGPLEARFPVLLGVDAREISGRKVVLDAGGVVALAYGGGCGVLVYKAGG